jgi:hypothetical protein
MGEERAVGLEPKRLVAKSPIARRAMAFRAMAWIATKEWFRSRCHGIGELARLKNSHMYTSKMHKCQYLDIAFVVGGMKGLFDPH